MSPFIFLRYLILPLALFTGWIAGSFWNFIVPILCFAVHPILCSVLTNKKENLEEDSEKENKFLYRLTPLLFVPVLLWSSIFFIWQSNSFTLIEFTGATISVGIVNGVLGFTLAHEFVHRRSIPEKISAWLLLLQNNYPHYGIEHVKGHHVYACTAMDPHAAAFNETFYQFLPRSVKFTGINAWRIEIQRLRKKGYNSVSFHNRILQHITIHLSLYTVLSVAGSWRILLFYWIQSTIAILLLHLTDYLQHYGLLRKETGNQKYERITALHAWGNTHAKAGFNLFQLDKHADHHLHPSHSYETLIQHKESPELPAPYSSMMLIAFFPPLWFKKMNKLIPPVLLQ